VSGSPPQASAHSARARKHARRRDELADFLRRRREALRPEELGLPALGRRRTPGLRREEVAQLAGVGVTWYTWLEQGRDVRASLDVLEAIARALRLTPAERTHLIVLGRGEPPPPQPAGCERPSPVLRRMLRSLEPSPAFILGRRWDYLDWNRAACALFGDLDRIPRERRNHIWLNFTDPARRELIADWERYARHMVAKLRADTSQLVGDPQFEELIGALRSASPEFCRYWSRHEVAWRGEGVSELRHPKLGALRFDRAVFSPLEAPEQRLVLYTPHPQSDTAAKMRRLLARQLAQRRREGVLAARCAPQTA